MDLYDILADAFGVKKHGERVFKRVLEGIIHKLNEFIKITFVDLVMYIDNEEFIAIEIEPVSPGIALENELKKCVVKLKTTLLCQQFMTKGYIVPLMCRERNKIARGYSMTYSELCERQLNDAQNEIGNSPIELVREGIILVG